MPPTTTMLLNTLPPLTNRLILDLGCGTGEQAAALVARGARVIAVDLNEDSLRQARARDLPGAEFRLADLREPLCLEAPADGIWSRFAAAYFPDLIPVLEVWKRYLRPGGWVALTEIDDLFGHAPLSDRAKALFEAYAEDALCAGRYDFHMGRKLAGYLEGAGFTVSQVQTLEDPELAFDGPAPPVVVEAWRARLDRMQLLRAFCGTDFEAVRAEFLACLARPDHRCEAKVIACLATH